MQDDQAKQLIQLLEQAVKLLQNISAKLDAIDNSVSRVISGNIKYL